jgi:hypothetical protein
VSESCPPRTIDAAVALVLSKLSDSFRDWLQQFEGDEIALYAQLARGGLTAGMSVRAILDLWNNPELLALLPRFYQDPDSASSFFLMECWRRLRANRATEPG